MSSVHSSENSNEIEKLLYEEVNNYRKILSEMIKNNVSSESIRICAEKLNIAKIKLEKYLFDEITSYRKLLAEMIRDGDATNEAIIICEKKLNTYEIKLEKFEILLEENPQRFVIFPLHFLDVWECYKKHLASFWTAEEITLSDDLIEWHQGTKIGISDNDKFFIKHILAFFASFDGIVNENLASRFMGEVQIPEARCFYGFQIAAENIHGEVYSLLIDTFAENAEEKDQLFRATETYPSLAKIQKWVLKWLSSDLPFNQRLIAFACIEGILFSGPFCAIFWIKKRGRLPGLTFSNELISRDEGLHTDFACLLKSMLKYPATHETIYKIVTEAVELEKEFINESLPCNLIGMNASEMSNYIEYVADRLLSVGLHQKKYYNTPNPFQWMELMSTPNKTNFFEKRVGEYGRAKFNRSKIDGSSQKNEAIALLEDF